MKSVGTEIQYHKEHILKLCTRNWNSVFPILSPSWIYIYIYIVEIDFCSYLLTWNLLDGGLSTIKTTPLVYHRVMDYLLMQSTILSVGTVNQ
jgi:hypothetical protein